MSKARTPDLRRAIAGQIVIDNPYLLLPYLLKILIKQCLEESLADLYWDNNLKASELALYRLIVKSAKNVKEIEGEYVQVSKATDHDFAQELQVHIRTCTRLLEALETKGYIKRENRLTPLGRIRAICLLKWTGNDRYIDLTFAQYPFYIQLELLIQVYRKHYEVVEDDTDLFLVKMQGLLRQINDLGLIRWLSGWDALYPTINATDQQSRK